MITAYHRPKTLQEALALLAQPETVPLGGGTQLNQKNDASYAVVDLQALGLDEVRRTGESLVIGAVVNLQTLLETEPVPGALKQAVRLEAPLNLRTMGSVAGALVSGDGRSPIATTMLALDASLTLYQRKETSSPPEKGILSLGDFYALRDQMAPGCLITEIKIPLDSKLAYEYVARTPADKPILCVALAQWPSGRLRLVLGGWGKSPRLAMDGKGSTGIEAAARNCAQEAGDEWAGAEYRRETAVVLAKRCLEK